MINIKSIGVDKSTKDRLDEYMADLMIDKLTYNEVINWLLDIKDNIMAQKELENSQKTTFGE